MSCARIVYPTIDGYIVSMVESILKLKLWSSTVEDKASECMPPLQRPATLTQHSIECDMLSVVLAGCVWHDSAS